MLWGTFHLIEQSSITLSIAISLIYLLVENIDDAIIDDDLLVIRRLTKHVKVIKSTREGRRVHSIYQSLAFSFYFIYKNARMRAGEAE